MEQSARFNANESRMCSDTFYKIDFPKKKIMAPKRKVSEAETTVPASTTTTSLSSSSSSNASTIVVEAW